MNHPFKSKPNRKWLRSISDVRRTSVLALPIVAGMVGQILIGLSDTLMVGQVGVVPLAACAFVNAIAHLPLVFSMGLLSSIAVLASHVFGAGNKTAAGEVLRHGLFLALLTGLATAVLLTFLRPALGFFGQPPEVVQAARPYLVLFGWSMLPALVAHACKQYCEALNRPWFPNWLLLGAVLLNILLNWILIYGHWGAPALGLEGAGWATLLARLCLTVALIIYILRASDLQEYRPALWWTRFRASEFIALIHLGGPVAIQHLLEVGAFAFAAVMMGWINAESIAAHQIAITCAATTFMFGWGIATAASIRVGQAWGAKRFHRVRSIGFIGIFMAASAMGLFAILFITAGKPIASLFVKSQPVILLTAQLLIVAAVFQIADGIQVAAICALRGLKDVQVPAFIAMGAYWIIAVPMGYLLAFPAQQGALGIWFGLATGLGAAAIALTWRFHTQTRSLPALEFGRFERRT